VRLPFARFGVWEWTVGQAPVPVTRPASSVPTLLASKASGSVVGVFDDGGVRWLEDGTWSGVSALPLEVRVVSGIALDAAGDPWLATTAGAFVQHRAAETWSEWRVPEDGPVNRIHDFARAPDGALWVATGDGLRVHRPDGGVEVLDRIDGRRLGTIIAVAVAPDGTVWASDSQERGGVLRRDRSGWQRFGEAEGFDGGAVHRIAFDSAGDPWFLTLGPLNAVAGRAGGRGGIVRFRDGRFERPLRRLGGREPDKAYGMAEAPDGSLWFATLAGLCRLAGEDWTCRDRGDGLRLDRVYAVAAALDGTVWFAHDEHGLGRLKDDEIRYVSNAEGLENTQVRDLAIDSRGWLWMTTGAGLALWRDGALTMVPYDTGRPRVRAWPVFAENDRVLVGTQGRGFATLDLAAIDRTPPRIDPFPAVVSDGAVWLRWRALAHDGWVDPARVRSRWRRDGGAWSAWDRRSEVEIADLDPGEHRFEFQALGTLGDRSEVVAVDVRLRPPWWARPHVIAPVAAMALAVAALGAALAIRRRRHDRELRERDRRFRDLVETAPDPIWTLDADGRVLSLNPAAARVLGAGRAAVAGKSFEEFLEADDRARFAGAFARAGEPGAPPESHPFRVRPPDGDAVVLETILHRAVDVDGMPVVRCFGRDATERRRLEERVRSTETLEAIGQLAGGVAHDFGNLMMAVTGYSQLVLRDLGPDERIRGDVERILRAGERAAGLTRQLMDFSRRRARRPRPIDLARLVLDLRPMVRAALREDIALTVETDARVGIVEGDPGQLQSVLFNLVANARDAMPGGGALRVAVRDRWVDASEAEQLRLAKAGWFAVLEVSDDGHGMDEVTRARMFEPFFTTKPHGLGTGLGLASVYGIVRQSRGAVDVRSAPGDGTAIRVLLPHVPASPSEDDPTVEIPEEPFGNGRTVLIVDDAPEILGFLVPLMRGWGFEVLEAVDGRDALTVADGHDRPIDVLLTDVVLPRPSGPELAARLRERDPGLRVLFMSGYLDGPGGHGDGRPVPPDRLIKPFGAADLYEALARVLA